MNLEYILEQLTQDMNKTLSNIQQDLMSNNVISDYLLKAMPYTYKKGYAVNVMLSSAYRKLDDKSEVHEAIKQIAEKYNAKMKVDRGAVIKIFVETK